MIFFLSLCNPNELRHPVKITLIQNALPTTHTHTNTYAWKNKTTKYTMQWKRRGAKWKDEDEENEGNAHKMWNVFDEESKTNIGRKFLSRRMSACVYCIYEAMKYNGNRAGPSPSKETRRGIKLQRGKGRAIVSAKSNTKNQQHNRVLK